MLNKKMWLWMIALLTVTLLAGCSTKTENTDQGEAASVETSETAESAKTYNAVIPFTLPDLEGNDVSVSNFEGKYILINFWATWCTYCDQEMPDLQKLQDKYKDDLVVLLVNVQESKDLIQPYLEKNKLSMLTVLDSKGEVTGEYGVTGMPASYFVTPDGRVIGFVQGMMTYDTMENSLKYVREQYELTK